MDRDRRILFSGCQAFQDPGFPCSGSSSSLIQGWWAVRIWSVVLAGSVMVLATAASMSSLPGTTGPAPSTGPQTASRIYLCNSIVPIRLSDPSQGPLPAHGPVSPIVNALFEVPVALHRTSPTLGVHWSLVMVTGHWSLSWSLVIGYIDISPHISSSSPLRFRGAYWQDSLMVVSWV